MTFHDFLWAADARFKRANREHISVLHGRELRRVVDWDENLEMWPELSKSHVFFLGDDQEFTDALQEIRPDLHKEMKERLPMPFDDVSVVTVVRKSMGQEAERAFHEYLFGQTPDYIEPEIPEGSSVWVMDRLIRAKAEDPRIAPLIRENQKESEKVKEWFFLARLQSFHKASAPLVMIPFGYVGPTERGTVEVLASQQLLWFVGNIVTNLEQVAAISHPANYVVKVTPELTPREQRKVSAGQPRPPAKQTHFIVVDHEVLVGMRRGGGTHASPIPHERRGHWRRLAERHHHARLLGKERIWVRPAWVGETNWSDHKHHYEVLIDFGKGGNL